MFKNYKNVKPIGSTPDMKTNDKDVTAGTTSEPNALKKGVSVGRKGFVKQAPHDAVDSLRGGQEDSNG